MSLPFPIPRRPCASWCNAISVTGHGDNHPDDRSCWSEFTKIPMTLGKPVAYGDNEYSYDWLDIVLVRKAGRDDAQVVVHNESGPEWFLTLDEATALRDALTAHLDTASATEAAT